MNVIMCCATNSVRAVFVGEQYTEKAHIISESSRLQRQTKIHDAQEPRTSAVSKEAHNLEQDHRAVASVAAEIPRTSRRSREPETSSHTDLDTTAKPRRPVLPNPKGEHVHLSRANSGVHHVTAW